MTMADLTATLLAAASTDAGARTQANQILKDWETQTLPDFVSALALVLASEDKDRTARQLAGLHLKNLLVSQDHQIQDEKHKAWKQIDARKRETAKQHLLVALRSTESAIQSAAAQACSEVAALELPYNEWPEFITCLQEYVSSEQQSDGVKVASLQCLGFSCERIGVLENLPEIDASTKGVIVAAIVQSSHPTRSDNIRLAATVALKKSLAFAQDNMENKQDRDSIMQVVCEATQSQNATLRIAAFECIAQLAFEYYGLLSDYMRVIFDVTIAAMKHDEEPVSKQAMEVWCTLCEVEMELIDEAAEGAERGIEVTCCPCANYAAGAIEHLVPLLAETLTKQEEDFDPDEYSINMAAACCLSLLAQTAEDAIVPVAMPFVQQNIQNENWQYREAASMAFASILDGVTPEVIGPYVNQVIPILLTALSDANISVKDTTAYLIGKICDLHVRAIPVETFPTLVNELMSKLLAETPRVSSQVCFALHNLAAAFNADDSGAKTGTNLLSPYMVMLLQSLLQAADREDACENNLRVAAYEAVGVVVQYSAPDCQPVILQLLPVTVERLQHSFSLAVLTNDDKERKEGLQGLLCGLIQVLCQKLQKEHVAPMANTIMSQLLQLLQVKTAAYHEDAFLAIGALVDTLGSEFEHHMVAFHPYLLTGIRTFEAFRVSEVAVGVVGDIVRAVESKIEPYCNELMSALVEALQDTTLHRSVKPPVIECIGEIAVAIGAGFVPYVQYSVQLLVQASNICAPNEDVDCIEYVNILRDSILESYTGILQGLRDGKRLDVFFPYIPGIMQFLQQLDADRNKNDLVLRKAVGLIGDIASVLGPSDSEMLSEPYVALLLKAGAESGNERIVETSSWARQLVEKLMQSSQN